MINIRNIINKSNELFLVDLQKFESTLKEIISNSSFLVLGGAGSIGQAISKEIFSRNPRKLHVVDISENNLTELVRDIRSSFGYIKGDFRTFALDIASLEYEAFFKNDGFYDYVLNLSALKHVRSEKDPFTLMRMINVNIINTKKTLHQAIKHNSKKYFAVSTDKASSPVNMMGASKKIMELILNDQSPLICTSTARFGNVAFSDGSLLYSFIQRFNKNQPIAVPSDIKRYFMTPKEAAILSLMSCLLGENRDIFFPKLSKAFSPIPIIDIAINFLESNGFEPYICNSEEFARDNVENLKYKNKWPIFLTETNTTGEKDCEEFYSNQDVIISNKYHEIGIIKNEFFQKKELLNYFESEINKFKLNGLWAKSDLVKLFGEVLTDFNHRELNVYLDGKM
jgi:FlaA1/EpsC-like NDP-sugar epimerase